MNKGDLVNKIAAGAELTKKQADAALKAALDAITEEMTQGGTVTLIGFGTFKVQKRDARTGRNPRTGEALKIPEKNVVKFSPSKALEEAAN